MDVKTLSASATIITSLVLAACGSKTESYTVDYLQENDDVRTQVLEDCKNNKQTSMNCDNANEAEAKNKAVNLENRINQ